MRFGVVYSHGDPGFSSGTDGPRRFGAAVQQAGFDYLAVPDHVLGADRTTRPDWQGPYDSDYPIREIFVHLGYLAAVTDIELVTSILVLPQRQTALVAKQAAELDQLTGGRLRLGVGVGWNEVEFEALGVDFRTRGALFDEQLAVLRLLWGDQVVSFHGDFHSIDRAGICPLPVNKAIPLWIGGGPGRRAGKSSERVFNRVARLGDGWISGPNLPIELLAPSFRRIRELAEQYGRDPGSIGLQSSLKVSPDSADRTSIEAAVEVLAAAGVTDVTVETRRQGLSLDQNVELVTAVGELVAKLR
jgi:probable F420-dependent oxidoreductase